MLLRWLLALFTRRRRSAPALPSCSCGGSQACAACAGTGVLRGERCGACEGSPGDCPRCYAPPIAAARRRTTLLDAVDWTRPRR